MTTLQFLQRNCAAGVSTLLHCFRRNSFLRSFFLLLSLSST